MKRLKLQLVLLVNIVLINFINAQSLSLVDIDRVNNSFLAIDSIPNINSIYVTPNFSEFDQINNRLILVMEDNNSQDRLYSIDVNTGAVVSNPLYNSSDFMDFQMNDSTGILYAIHRFRANLSSFTYSLVSIDPITASYSTIDTLTGITGIDFYQGHTVLDPIQGHFIFRSENSFNAPNRLYSIDVNTGSVIHSPLFPVLSDSADQVTHLEFDDSTGSIYGLHWDNSEQKEFLVTVNPITGLHTIIDSIPGVKFVNPLSNRVTFDPINRLYIFRGHEVNSFGDGFLYSLDVNNASIVSKRPYQRRSNPDSIITPFQLHAQHSTGKLFGVTFIDYTITSVEENLNTKPLANIYPNPSHDQFVVSFQQTQKNIELKLFNMKGQLVHEKQGSNISILQIKNQEDWPEGVYILQVQTENGILNKRLILR